MNNYSKAFSEVLEILKYISKEEYEKIPKDMIEIMKNECDKNMKVKYNPSLTLIEQGISREARTIIAVLYRDYFATEEEKKIIKEKELKELIEEEREKKENYKGLNKLPLKDEINENFINNLPDNIKSTSFMNRIINFFKRLKK